MTQTALILPPTEKTRKRQLSGFSTMVARRRFAGRTPGRGWSLRCGWRDLSASDTFSPPWAGYTTALNCAKIARVGNSSNQLERARRAAARRALGEALPIRSFRLGHEPTLDSRRADSIADRLMQLAQLSKRAYQLSGASPPQYTRQTIPGRVIRSPEHGQ